MSTRCSEKAQLDDGLRYTPLFKRCQLPDDHPITEWETHMWVSAEDVQGTITVLRWRDPDSIDQREYRRY